MEEMKQRAAQDPLAAYGAAADVIMALVLDRKTNIGRLAVESRYTGPQYFPLRFSPDRLLWSLSSVLDELPDTPGQMDTLATLVELRKPSSADEIAEARGVGRPLLPSLES